MREAKDIEVRLLTEDDLEAAMRLKACARWNQTEDDWRRLLRHDPDGCFAALIDKNVVATTTTTAYGQTLAWIGMVLVDPEFRRRGIATTLVRLALRHLSEAGVRTVKLDATPAGCPVYEGLGFEVESHVERWAGTAAGDFETTTLEAADLHQLFTLDSRAFGAARSKLLKGLIDHACVAPSIIRIDGQLSGYALARRGIDAFYIGPLVAMDSNTSARLLDGVLSQLAGNRTYVDLNTTFNGGAEQLARRGFVKQRELIRMRLGEKNEAGTSVNVFAIAGPEVG